MLVFNETLYQVLFSISFALWLVATLIATRAYAVTVMKMGWGYPFVLASLIIGIMNMLEAGMYLGTVILALDAHDNIRLLVLYYIPIGLSLKAIAFIIIGAWIMRQRERAGK